MHRTPGHELTTIVDNDIQTKRELYQEGNISLYNTPWKERCLRIATLRLAFKENKHLFLKDHSNILVDANPENCSPTVTTTKQLESALLSSIPNHDQRQKLSNKEAI